MKTRVSVWDLVALALLAVACGALGVIAGAPAPETRPLACPALQCELPAPANGAPRT